MSIILGIMIWICGIVVGVIAAAGTISKHAAKMVIEEREALLEALESDYEKILEKFENGVNNNENN